MTLEEDMKAFKSLSDAAIRDLAIAAIGRSHIFAGRPFHMGVARRAGIATLSHRRHGEDWSDFCGSVVFTLTIADRDFRTRWDLTEYDGNQNIIRSASGLVSDIS